MFTPGMLALRRASAAAGGGTLYKADGNPPEAPTHAFITSSTTTTPYAIWDISNPAAPSLSSSYAVGTYGPATGQKVSIKDNYAYIPAYNSDEITVVDVSDPDTLGASQIIDQFAPGTASLDAPTQAIAHPTKDILWVSQYNGSKVHTIDISDPANLSIISTVSNTNGNGWGAQTSPDGEYFYVTCTGGVISRWELDASGNATNETTFSGLYSQTITYCLNYQVSPIDSENYIAVGGSSNAVQVAKLGTDDTIDSVSTPVVSSTIYDRPAAICGAQYLPNHSTSYDNAWFYTARDDDMIGVFAELNGTVTNLVNTTDTDIDGVQGLDAYEDYLYAVASPVDRLTIYQWDGLNSLTQISNTSDVTNLDGVTSITLYKP
jgi:hypothetical protein